MKEDVPAPRFGPTHGQEVNLQEIGQSSDSIGKSHGIGRGDSLATVSHNGVSLRIDSHKICEIEKPKLIESAHVFDYVFDYDNLGVFVEQCERHGVCDGQLDGHGVFDGEHGGRGLYDEPRDGSSDIKKHLARLLFILAALQHRYLHHILRACWV